MKYFVTTGTSLRTSSRCWLPNARAPIPDPTNRRDRSGDKFTIQQLLDKRRIDLLDLQRESVKRVMAALSPRNGKSWQEYLSTARGVVRDYFDFTCWNDQLRRLLPAELAPLVAMCSNTDFRPRNAEVVFVYGEKNTKEAFLCAAILDELIERKRSQLYPTATTEHTDLGRLEGPELLDKLTEDKTIEDLDVETTLTVSMYPDMPGLEWEPSDSASFTEHVTGDGRRFKSLCERLGPAKDDNFVMTAGYKAVLLALAIQISHSERTAKIYYLHDEESSEPVVLDLDGRNVTVR